MPGPARDGGAYGRGGPAVPGAGPSAVPGAGTGPHAGTGPVPGAGPVPPLPDHPPVAAPLTAPVARTGAGAGPPADGSARGGEPSGSGTGQPGERPAEPSGERPGGGPRERGGESGGGSADYPLLAPAPASPQTPAQPPAGTAAPPAAAGPGAPADPRTAVGYGNGADGPAPGTGKACVACRTGLIDKDGYCENCGHAQPRERDHMERDLDLVAAVTDRGLRHHRNEDAFTLSTTALPDGAPAVVAVVCDGVSSSSRPDEASAAAAEAAGASLLDALPAGTPPGKALHEAVLTAGEAVNSLAGSAERAPGGQQPHMNAPACTIVAAVAAGDTLTVGWIGDSRAYWVPDDRTLPARRLTEDDSWAAQMVVNGLMSEAEAYADPRAHAITGWLGADAYELDPHTASCAPGEPGVLVVCTDGLWNYAEAAEDMALAVPADARSRPLHGAQALVGYALDGGGHDNVTVAVLPFPGSPAGAGSA
ncbi:PP2C family serine/threonine-protein phosphatase [Streptomyces sp. Ru87]|uniref:PP2C family protein-serine/threonine phosphatase n=1 Tax=Streptomyces sp. Ru87 TaxID=2044307 RepID=UPI00211D92FA|nr:PP2C family serine/threonine-protein phosphatase [Streptomyces sp. Ru87]